MAQPQRKKIKDFTPAELREYRRQAGIRFRARQPNYHKNYKAKWIPQDKAKHPQKYKDQSRRAYLKLKADPAKYKAMVDKQKAKRPYREPKPILTPAEKLAKKRKQSRESMKRYWQKHPDKYKEHLAKCSASQKAKRHARKTCNPPDAPPPSPVSSDVESVSPISSSTESSSATESESSD